MPKQPDVVTLSADYWTERGSQSIVAIIAHGTGGTNSIDTLQHGGGRKVSAHALITKLGTIYRFVPDARAANHAGANSSSFKLGGRTYRAAVVNRATFSFELENLNDGKDSYPDPQLLSMGWQINQWRIAHGFLPIFRHAEIDPTRKIDPVNLSVEDIERWARRATIAFAPLSYRVRGLPVFQRQDLTGPIAVYLLPGDRITIDQRYDNGAGHDSLGRGFVRLADLEAE